MALFHAFARIQAREMLSEWTGWPLGYEEQQEGYWKIFDASQNFYLIVMFIVPIHTPLAKTSQAAKVVGEVFMWQHSKSSSNKRRHINFLQGKGGKWLDTIKYSSISFLHVCSILKCFSLFLQSSHLFKSTWGTRSPSLDIRNYFSPKLGPIANSKHSSFNFDLK